MLVAIWRYFCHKVWHILGFFGTVASCSCVSQITVHRDRCWTATLLSANVVYRLVVHLYVVLLFFVSDCRVLIVCMFSLCILSLFVIIHWSVTLRLRQRTLFTRSHNTSMELKTRFGRFPVPPTLAWLLYTASYAALWTKVLLPLVPTHMLHHAGPYA